MSTLNIHGDEHMDKNGSEYQIFVKKYLIHKKKSSRSGFITTE